MYYNYMKVTKEDIQNLTKAQLKKIIDDVKNVLGLKTKQN